MSLPDITWLWADARDLLCPCQARGAPLRECLWSLQKTQEGLQKGCLVDDDVVNLVNLRFMSQYHGRPAEVVMDRRGRGERFVVMNDEFCEEKRAHGDKGKGKVKHKKGKDK